MKAERLRICNYKSLGDNRNELYIGDYLTVIIGKNESGKTNITDAAGELDFSRCPYLIEDADKKLNRFSKRGEILITLTLERKGKYSDETEITARRDSISVSGGLVGAVISNKAVLSCLNELESYGNNVWMGHKFFEDWQQGKPQEKTQDYQQEKLQNKLQDWQQAKPQDLEQPQEKTQNYRQEKQQGGLRKRFRDSFCKNPYLLLEELQHAAENSTDPKIKSLLFEIHEKTAAYVNELPYILVTNNDGKNSFKEYYFLSEIAALNSSDIFLKLLSVAGIDKSGLADVFDSGKPVARELLKAGFEQTAEKISEFTGKGFELGFEIRNERLYLTTVSQGKRIMFDELPVSEKWHFALLIDILWHNIKNKNILFVFDLPGLYMHVNAQKELINIFKNITMRGHQIIYTTHSPFLLDINDIASMRAVEKSSGQTCIYNKIYAGELTKGTGMETLTPIFEALGVSFSARHGSENRLNLIVEGISDYYYIKGMLHYLAGGSENLPYILPSVGASNICNIASILIGWGLPFKAIVDYDEEGKNAFDKMQHKLGLKAGENVFYVNGRTAYRTDGDCKIEDMLDKSDLTKIQTALGKRTKALVSREFYDLMLAGKLKPSPRTVNNFEALFAALGLL